MSAVLSNVPGIDLVGEASDGQQLLRIVRNLRAGGRVIGGATLLPLPPDEEFEIGGS